MSIRSDRGASGSARGRKSLSSSTRWATDEAVAAAAKLANLTDYDSVRIREEYSPFSAFFGEVSAKLMTIAGVEQRRADASRSIVRKAIAAVEKEAAFFGEFNDPNALYARCLSCAN